MKRLLVIFLSMALLAFGIFHVLHEPDSTLRGMATSPPSSTTERLATDVASHAVPTTAPADATTPTWLLPVPRPGASERATTPSATATAATAPTAQEKIARLNAVLEKLNRLQAQPNLDAKAASAAIAELERINGSPVMNGLRLDVLRENVEVADRIEVTAMELQHLQKSSPAPSPEQAAQIQSKTAELIALQSRLRNDILQSPQSVGVRP